jgi:hypothetical protein
VPKSWSLSSAPTSPHSTSSPLSSASAAWIRSTVRRDEEVQLDSASDPEGVDLDPIAEEETVAGPSLCRTSTVAPFSPPPRLPNSQPSTPASRLLLAQLSLCLPTSPVRTAVRPTYRPTYSPTASTESTAGQDVRNQPFMDKSRLLSEAG